MESKEQRPDLIQTFAETSFRLDPDLWGEHVSEEENQLLINSFYKSPDFQNLFISWSSESGLSLSPRFPPKVQTKVLSVSKSSPEALTEENLKENLNIQEVHAGDAMGFTINICQQVTCPLLSNPESVQSVAEGEGEEPKRIMERQRNRTQTMRAQVGGGTFLPHPQGVHSDCFHGDSEWRKLLQACDATINEWAELVSGVLKQDASEAVLMELKPRPSEEFSFWENRLKNLHSLWQQLQSSRAQQMASIVQQADGVLWSTLTHTCRDVEEGLREAEEVTTALTPLKEALEQVEQVEYQELLPLVLALVQQLNQVQVQSQFYRDPHRLFVLLTMICNLYIQRSRKFLRGEEVMCGLVSDPGQVQNDVRLVTRTLHTLRETLSKIQNQNQDSESLTHLETFTDLDQLLRHLHSIQEVLGLTLQWALLDQVVLSGGSGGTWTDEVQDLYQVFLVHLKVLSESPCDLMDPEDQSLQFYVDQFRVQVLNQETRLGSVLSRALEDCSKSSSAAQLLQMFWFLLDRPLIRDQLVSQLKQLVDLVLEELDQTERLLHGQGGGSESSSRSMSPAAARLSWTSQLRLRAEDSLRNYRTIQDLLGGSGESQVVSLSFQKVLVQLEGFRDQVRLDWICQLDQDSGFVLDQPVLQRTADGLLEVGCRDQLRSALRDLRCVTCESELELRPQAALLLTCSDDITQSLLTLSHMVSCYNQVLADAQQVELPLIQDQLQELDQHLRQLQGTTWTCAGLQQLVQIHRDRVLIVHATVSEARANMAAMTQLIQGWAELHLLQHSGDSELRGGANEQTQKRLQEDGQELLRLIQVNRCLYGADETSQSWISYLDHMDLRVQDGLIHLLLQTLHFLCDSMAPQSGGGVLLVTSLKVQEPDSVFVPSVGVGLSDHLKSIITDVYEAANQLPKISASRHGDFKQQPSLCELEQEVMRGLQRVEKEAELLRAGLDRFSFLWESEPAAVMEEFLTYGRQLGPEELEAEVAPPTLKDYRREMESLTALSREVAHLDDVIILEGWLQVDLRPFRASLLTIITELKHLYTQHLLTALTDSLQQVALSAGDEEACPPPSAFPLTDTVVVLEAAGVQLPDHLAAQLQLQRNLNSEREGERAAV